MLVLVVDDSEVMRINMASTLRGQGWRVQEACSGQDAVEKYLAARPDIVTMDISMPGLDGLEALRRIKEIDPGAKIIVVSAWAHKDNLMQAIKLGACDFLAKPFTGERMIQAIKRVAGPKAEIKN
ncbi:MAG: response regulator [Bacillota bacterium]